MNLPANAANSAKSVQIWAETSSIVGAEVVNSGTDMSLYKHPKGTYPLPSENMPSLALGSAAPYWLFRRTK